MKTWELKSGSKIHLLFTGPYNAYLIEIKGAFILVDTGRKPQLKILKKRLEDRIPKDKSLSYLVLTHTHYDHCQNAKAINRLTDCTIVVSKKEANEARKGYTRLPSGTNLLTMIIVPMGRVLGKLKLGYGYPPFIPDILIDGLSGLSGIDGITIIETPGHSAGSISVIVDEEIALVGDAMFGLKRSTIFPPFADDISELKRSWEKLLQTKCNLFLPGHGQAINRKQIELYLQKHKSSDR